MTRNRVDSPPSKAMLAGAIGDGAFKVVLGFAFVVAGARLGDLLGVPTWLMVVSGAALLVGGGIELRYVRRRPMATCLRLMVAYDSGWVVATAVALLMAGQGSTAGGEIWVAYLTAAPLAFAALLVGAAPSGRPPAPDAPAGDRAV